MDKQDLQDLQDFFNLNQYYMCITIFYPVNPVKNIPPKKGKEPINLILKLSYS